MTIIGPDATGVDGRDVRVDGAAATSVRVGLLPRAVARRGALHVSIGGRTLDVRRRRGRARRHRAARADHARLPRVAHDRLRRDARVVADERARRRASRSSRRNRLSYQHARRPGAIVIGARRWDRRPPARRGSRRRRRRSTSRSRYWTSPTNVHLVAPEHDHVPRPPDPRLVPGDVRTTARPTVSAHDRRRALHDRPLRRVRRAGGGLAAFAVALRLLADELEEARRVLERREAARRVAGPARPAQRRAAGRREHARGADEPADRERAQPRPATVAFHATSLDACGS